ncbi:hypothetical protein ANO14919_098610 [Xylariales sp. No.14919]|nr:hypothetical protein ANO14919_098610 [Xylariales sp. No.14919]
MWWFDQQMDRTKLSMAESSNADVSADVEQYADAILRVCSYHRWDLDRVVIRSYPHQMQKVQASLQSAFETWPTADLGTLGRLPIELIFLILNELDIRSFFRFRQVNRKARVIATDVREYSLVSRHGLEGLRGLLRGGLAPFFTVRSLYRALITDKCATCGAFGGYLFLFTVQRCCFDCLQSQARYRVLPLLGIDELAKVCLIYGSGKILRTVPGSYSMVGRPTTRPNYLIAASKATEILLAIRAIGEHTVHKLRLREEKQGQRFMAATAYPYYSLEDTRVEHGVSCKGCQVRYLLHHGTIPSHSPPFSIRGFLLHFSQCEEAQCLWAASEKGDTTCR